MKQVEIFTDGACSGNPGPGGWGTILRCNGVEKELSGGDKDTTNNRMEMQACIAGLNALKEECSVTLTTDSNYVKDGITKWIANWKRRGWKTADGKPVKNQDLWMQLDSLAETHTIQWKWVKGHSGHVENERCDELARAAIPR